jgi:hypothetical protein
MHSLSLCINAPLSKKFLKCILNGQSNKKYILGTILQQKYEMSSGKNKKQTTIILTRHKMNSASLPQDAQSTRYKNTFTPFYKCYAGYRFKKFK